MRKYDQNVSQTFDNIVINSGRVLGRMIGEGGSHVNKDCTGARLEGFADGVKVVD